MKDMMDDDVENVGIMQGFLEDAGEKEDELEEEEYSDEATSARMLDRRPDSPEILMNNLRGDMRSIDARREELADLVGFAAASETPEPVLAMLQPVLAQQGGLGALPQSAPMAQGPQPPMLPPPGGEMGNAPPGAPPLPPGGAPPIPGGMAAPAGPPPGGGMAPGPMIGPDGQPIPPEGIPPIAMRDGGLVQRFRDGSDEEGVTQDDEERDLPAAQTLAQRPMAVPTLEAAMKTRLPEYERLLGADKSASQSGLLFDIAGAALNFAANRGPRGEVLRGSPMARLAGAFSNLPAAVQKRVSDIETTQRQLRMLAIQAGEKDRDEIQGINAKLAAAGIFGKGDWEMDIFNTPGLMERYAAGQTTPAENNLIASAITSYTQPRYESIVDPVTRKASGYQELPGNRLPDFVAEARRMRSSGTVPAGASVALPSGTPVASAAPVVDETPTDMPAPLLSEGGRKPTEAGTAQPVDRPVDEPAYLSREEAMAAPISLWRDKSKIAGPFAYVYATFSQIPGAGDPVREITLARSQANILAEEAIEAFLKSAQNSVTEQKMLSGLFNLRPAFAKDPDAYGTNLIAISTVLDQVLSDYRKKADTSPGSLGSTLRPEQVAEAREKISILERLKRSFDLPPTVYSYEEAKRLPPEVKRRYSNEVLFYGVTPARIADE